VKFVGTFSLGSETRDHGRDYGSDGDMSRLKSNRTETTSISMLILAKVRERQGGSGERGGRLG
jgi:hypothetical protein